MVLLILRGRKYPNSTGKKPHEHQPVEGAAPGYGPRSKLSQIYPYRFCKTLADFLGLYLGVSRKDKTAMLIEDILEMTFQDDDQSAIECINSLVASATQELDVTDHFVLSENNNFNIFLKVYKFFQI